VSFQPIDPNSGERPSSGWLTRLTVSPLPLKV
jgi:hypothetical protein